MKQLFTKKTQNKTKQANHTHLWFQRKLAKLEACVNWWPKDSKSPASGLQKFSKQDQDVNESTNLAGMYFDC